MVETARIDDRFPVPIKEVSEKEIAEYFFIIFVTELHVPVSPDTHFNYHYILSSLKVKIHYGLNFVWS